MSFQYWFPLLLVVTANVGYHIVAKETNPTAPPFLALAVTYFVSFVLCIIAYLASDHSLPRDLPTLNWASPVWGLTLVAVEFGYLLMYRAGWKVSMASLIANLSVAILLVGVGVLGYKEILLPKQVIGIVLCLVGVFFLHI